MTETHRCVLYRIDGALELWLHHGGRVIALATCTDENRAKALAQQWLEVYGSDANAHFVRDGSPSRVP
jgi:hypothetical protein